MLGPSSRIIAEKKINVPNEGNESGALSQPDELNDAIIEIGDKNITFGFSFELFGTTNALTDQLVIF